MSGSEIPALVLAPSVDAERRRRFEIGLQAGLEIHVYSGSTEGRCAKCDAPVWIGPRSTAMVGAGAARPVCETCLGTAIAAGWRPRAIGNFENPETSHVR